MWGADVVGMTLVPECVLAREAELCYASTAMITDYDCWKDHPVTTDEIIMQRCGQMSRKSKKSWQKPSQTYPKNEDCDCKCALKNAFVYGEMQIWT